MGKRGIVKYISEAFLWTPGPETQWMLQNDFILSYNIINR